MANKNQTVYSVIVPIYNEIESIHELYRRVCETMEKMGNTWELIMVDDGSTDGSTQAILALADEDEHIKPLIFARNFAHQICCYCWLGSCQW